MKIYFRNIVRNQKNQPLYTLVALLGLTVGIVSSLLAFLWGNDELSFEKFHSDSQQIFRILTVHQSEGKENKIPYILIPVVKTLMNDYPEVDKATFVKYESKTPLESNDHAVDVLPAYTNAYFFDVFDGFQFVEGNRQEALATEGSVVLNESIAKKLFGDQPAFGKTVAVVNEDQSYTVGGVVRIPKQTHINFGMITLMDYQPFLREYFPDNWERSEISTAYVKLFSGTNIKEFQEKISNHLTRYKKTEEMLTLQPLTRIHLYTDYTPALYDQNISSYKYVWIFTGLAVFILIMSVLNYVVLFMVRSANRSKEIGIKKINGASIFNIFKQFSGEAILQTLLITIVSFFIVLLLLPSFNLWVGKAIVFHFSPWTLFVIFLVAILIGLLAGYYPSAFLPSFSPIDTLKGGIVVNSKNKFIRTLVVIQFSIAIIFLISTFVFARQLNFLENKNLGFNDKNILIIDAGYVHNMKPLKEELLKNPNVLDVSASVKAPIDFVSKSKIKLAGSEDSLLVSFFWVDEDFAKTYQLQMVQGDFLKTEDSSPMLEYQKETVAKKQGKKYLATVPIVINQTACDLMGFDHPIGQRIGNYEIKGVVKDFNFESLYHPLSPLILVKEPQIMNTLNIRFSSANSAQTVKWICDTYNKLRKTSFISYHYFDDMTKEKYNSETHLKALSSALSILAVFISSLGILALSIFLSERRTKEIGIRKVNGAKVSEVMTMLNKDFVKWVVVAFLIATPIAWYAMYKWLENFAYKISLSWWIFALSGLLTLGIALATVSWQSWRAATRNPVEALRYE